MSDASPRSSGIHHITAIASDPQANIDFYTRTLGLRCVKKTVNFDDPGSYHFYFGDAVGSPGTIITFFPWPGARRGRVGAGQVTASAYAVPRGSINAFWAARLASLGVTVFGRSTRFGEAVIEFEDHDGTRLELIESDAPSPSPWAGSDVPAEHALRAFHSATLTVRTLKPTEHVLVERLGLKLVGAEGNRRRYAGDAPHGQIIDVIADENAERGKSGAGVVHHIAFRAATDADQLAWLGQVEADGLHASPVMERFYFRSIYFREPGGVLFEIATDAPGFAADESPETLGESLKLPPMYEQHRAKIEAALPKLS
jgi:glyoxalase family protein